MRPPADRRQGEVRDRERESINLLVRPQASPARPSGKSSIKDENQWGEANP